MEIIKRIPLLFLLSIKLNTAYAFFPWEALVFAEMNYARIHGMAQTPRGGSPA